MEFAEHIIYDQILMLVRVIFSTAQFYEQIAIAQDCFGYKIFNTKKNLPFSFAHRRLVK